jgi:hypothetical protein
MEASGQSTKRWEVFECIVRGGFNTFLYVSGNTTIITSYACVP